MTSSRAIAADLTQPRSAKMRFVATAVTSFVFASQEDLDVTAERLARLLGLVFALHDSSFRGGEYLLAGDFTGEHFIVQRNEDDDEPAEHVHARTIVYTEATERPGRVEAAAAQAGLMLIRREDWSRP